MEVLVKTYTRHRDPNSRLYLRDWTAGDILQIQPDGFFTQNRHAGAKRMGIVLRVPGRFRWQDYTWTPEEIDRMERRLIPWRRAKYYVDLSKLFGDRRLRDLYNHDYAVPAITVNKNPIDLFEPVELRTVLNPYDRAGTFTSGTVDVGPNGHSDANTFFEFESNCGDLTGDLTGDCDEAFNESNANIIDIAGFADNGYTLTFRISGAGRHQGKWDTNYYYMSYGGGKGAQIELNQNADLTHFALDGFQITVSRNNIYNQYVIRLYQTVASTLLIKNCIINEHTNAGSGTASGICMRAWKNNGGRIENCVIKNVDNIGIEGMNTSHDGAINCVVYNAGGDAYYTLTCTSCAAHTITGADYSSCDGDYNAGEDGSQPGTHDVDLSGEAHGDIWTDAPNGDFSLVSGSPLIDAGDPANSTSTDIIGTSRSTPDIGAWEYVAGGASIPVFVHHYKQQRMM